MATVKEGKEIRVKAGIMTTPVYKTLLKDAGQIYKLYKGGEVIGKATGFVSSDDPITYEMVEVLIDNGSAASWMDGQYLVEIGYVDVKDIDVLGDDISDDDQTVVIDKSGKELGTLSEFPKAILTGKKTTQGKDIYLVVDSPGTEPAPSIPIWLKVGIGVIVVVAVFALGFIIYKTQKQPA